MGVSFRMNYMKRIYLSDFILSERHYHKENTTLLMIWVFPQKFASTGPSKSFISTGEDIGKNYDL